MTRLIVTVESSAANPPNTSFTEMPPEIRNQVYRSMLDHTALTTHGNRLHVKCKRIDHAKEVASFKASFYQAALRKIPVIRNEFTTLMWEGKTPVFCNCSKKPFDATFLHFPSHHLFPTVEYYIHPGGLMTHALLALKAFVRALAHMQHKGTVKLSGVLYEVRMFEAGLRFIHNAFDDGADFNKAFQRLATDPSWIKESGLYAQKEPTCLVKPKKRHGHVRGERTTKEVFSEARDRVLQSGATMSEALEAAKAARDAFCRSKPKVSVMRYGNPNGVLTKPVHLSWEPRMPIVGL